MTFSIGELRKRFPQLQTKVHGKPLVYLDSAASSLKLDTVISRLHSFYQEESANIHRGVHFLSEHGTILYEKTRDIIQEYLRAEKREEIIFTKGTTDSINLLAASFSSWLQKNDVILLSTLEHHSNIVPWQMAAEKQGAKVLEIPINDLGEIDLESYRQLLKENSVKMVSVNWVSNALGTINPVKEMIQLAHQYGALIHLDAAQSLAHIRPDVVSLDLDFLSFSSHKIFGPFGVGVLYGKEKLLNKLPPYQGGGDMIDEVSFEKTTYNSLPHKFEAGTPVIAEVIALKEAFIFLMENNNEDNFAKHEKKILDLATSELKKIKRIKIIGESTHKVSVISFVAEGAHHHDLGLMLDRMGIAVRTGHHCTQPLMKRFKITGTTRASFSIYNTEEEALFFVKSVARTLDMI